MTRRVPKHGLPDLPEEFVQYVKENKIQTATLHDLATAFKKWEDSKKGA